MTKSEFDSPDAAECESPSLQPNGSQDGTLSPVDDTCREFPGREIGTSGLVKLDPIDAVNKFVGHRTASVNEAVLSTIAAAEAIKAFQGDSAKSQQWLGDMVRVKALTKTDASAGLTEEKRSASNLSKLRKIAKYEHILRVPKIASLLPSGGFATLYECARLGELLEKQNPATAVDDLRALLLEHDGPVTRDWLKKEGDKRRPPKPADEFEAATKSVASLREQSATGAEEAHPPAREQPTQSGRADKGGADEGAAASSWTSDQTSIAAPAEMLVEEASEDAVDAEDASGPSDNPTGEQEDKDDNIDNDQSDEEGAEGDAIVAVVMNVMASMSMDDLVEIGKVIERLSGHAIVLLHGPLGFLLSSRVELDRFGVNRCQAIYVVDDIIGSDLINNLALAVYTRDNAAVPGRLSDCVIEMETDPAILADHILDGVAGRKVLIFGSTTADGWESVAGSNPHFKWPMKVLDFGTIDVQ